MSWLFSRRLVDLYREDMQNLPEKIHSKSPGAGVLRGDLSPDQQRRETEGAEDRSPEGQDLQEAPQSGRVFHDVRGQSPVCRGQEDGSGACDDYGTAHSKTPSPGRMRAPHQRHQDGQPVGKSRTSNPCRALTNPREALLTTKEANPRKVCVSSPSSPGLVEAYSGERSSDGARFAPLSLMPSPQPFLRRGKTTAFFRPSQYGLTCERLTECRGAAVLMWFLAGFHAKTSARPERGQASPENEAGSGVTSPGSFARWDRVSRSWKTPHYSQSEGSTSFSGTWPRWGTMRNGVCSEQMTQARRTEEKESGSRPNWQTPVAVNRAIFLTPNASDSNKWSNQSEAERVAKGQYVRLCHQLGAGGSLNPTWVEWLMGWPILWTSLGQLNKHDFEYWQKISAAPLRGEGVRNVWWDVDPSTPPQGRKSDQQFSGQCAGVVPAVPRGRPHEGRDMGDGSRENGELHHLRDDIPPGLARESGEDLQCPVSSRKRKKGRSQAVVPRVVTNSINRVDRLRCLGNGQVPAVAALAWEILST